MLDSHPLTELTRLTFSRPFLSHSSQDLTDFILHSLQQNLEFTELLNRSSNYLPPSERKQVSLNALYDSLFSEMLVQCSGPLPSNLRQLFKIAKIRLIFVSISKEVLVEVMSRCSKLDYELPLLLVESELFDVNQEHKGVQLSYNLGLIDCINCLPATPDATPNQTDFINNVASLIDQALLRNIKFQKNFFARLFYIPILSLEVKQALFEKIIRSPRFISDKTLLYKIDLFFLLLNSNQGSSALSLYKSFDKSQLKAICKERRDKYQFSVLRALQGDLMVDLSVEVALLLWEVFTEEGVLELVETEVNLLYALNPIKSGLVLLEFYNRLRTKIITLNTELTNVISSTKELLGNMIKSINRDTLLKAILEDTDFRGRTVLSLLKQHLELIVLIQDFIQARFHFGQDGGINLRKAPFAQHSVFQSICSLESLSKGLKTWTSRKSKGAGTSMYFVFRRSIMAKFFHHWIYFLIFVILGQLYINLTTTTAVEFGFQVYQEARINPFIPQSMVKGRQAYRYFEICIQITGFLMYLLSVTVLTDWALLWISNKPCSINFGHLLLLSSLVCFTYAAIGMNNFIIDFNSRTYLLDLQWALDFARFLEIYGHFYVNAASASYLLNWLYLLYSIRVFQYLGILVVIISKMLYSLVPFLLVQLSIISIFALSGTISYSYDTSGYSSVKNSFLSLFSASLGQVSVDQLTNSSTGSSLFLLAFLIINAILLLNMLVAILLEVYQVVKTYSQGYFLQQVLSLDPLWLSNPQCGALTFKQGPLVVINFLLVPLYSLRLKNFNYVMEFILYLPSLFLSMVIFICFDLFYFLYSYRYIFRYLCNVRGATSSKHCIRQCKAVALFIIYPFLLPPTLVRDLIVFCLNIFAKEKQFLCKPYTPPKLTKSEIVLLIQTLKGILRDKLRTEVECLFVMTRDVIRAIRDEMELSPSYHNICSLRILRFQIEQKSYNAKLESFLRIKQFLWQNSHLQKELRFIYAKGLLQALISLAMSELPQEEPRKLKKSKKTEKTSEMNQSFNTFHDSVECTRTHDAELYEEREKEQDTVVKSGVLMNGRMGWFGTDPNRIKIMIPPRVLNSVLI